MTITLELDPAMIRLLVAQCVLVVVLMLIAGLHIHWGLGGFWPGRDGTTLVERVVGRTPGMKPPSPVACFLVALGMIVTTVAVMVRCTVIVLPPEVNLSAAILVWIAAITFIIRGILGFFLPVFSYAKGTPFFKLNLLIYSPLCLGLGYGLFWITKPLSQL